MTIEKLKKIVHKCNTKFGEQFTSEQIGWLTYLINEWFGDMFIGLGVEIEKTGVKLEEPDKGGEEKHE